MNKACKERRAGRGNPRPSDLTLKAMIQMADDLDMVRTGRRSFDLPRRCSPLNMLAYPAALRLTGGQTPPTRYGKITEYGP